MTDQRLSEETVNAFVDDELDMEERLHILRLSEQYQGVKQQLRETRTLKALVGQAYAQDPWMNHGLSLRATRPGKARLSGPALAAGIALTMFVAGIAAGWGLSGPAHTRVAQQNPIFMELGDLASLGEARGAGDTPSNIVLHLATSDAKRVEDALEKVERFVRTERGSPHRVGLEIVANGPGLDLLRVAGTPYEARVKQLAGNDFVTILACRRAVERLREQGVDVDLIPEADMAASALDRIIQRLREGWVYVRA